MGRFVLADLRRHWIGALAIALIVALATALGVVVTLQERALRLGSARAAAAFDLVIGAPGSETQLVLSTVFLQAAPLPLMPGTVLAYLLADPRVAWAAPVGFGDFIEDHPVVGTTQAMLDGFGGLAGGRSFAKLGEAVAGAATPFAIGTTFHPVHGQLSHAGEVHMGASYTVTGRMKPTGTPWDRAVLVPIEAVWQVHEGEHHDGEGHEEKVHDAHAGEEGLEIGEDHEHEDHAPEAQGDAHDDEHASEAGAAHGGFDADAPIRPEAVSASDAPGLPAILVKPVSFADAYTLRQDYRGERTLAVFPGEVLTRLYGTLGDARRVLSAVAFGAQGLVAAAILLVVTVQVLQRRRQIGALRAFGAPRAVIFAIVWLEALVILGVGLIAGFILGYFGVLSISARLAAGNGVALPVTFAPSDGFFFLALLLACGLVAIVPALLAYRQPPAAALRS